MYRDSEKGGVGEEWSNTHDMIMHKISEKEDEGIRTQRREED